MSNEQVSTPVGVASPRSERVAGGEYQPPRGPGLSGWLLQRLCRALGPVPLRFELWNGTVVPSAQGEPRATLRINSLGALVRVALNPGVYLCEGFRTGQVVVEGDLVGALESVFERWRRGGSRPASAYRPRTGVLRRARRRVRQHYDLGNEFYRLWLDDEMVYTCAYFPSPDLGLEEAQIAKLDHVCRKLRLRPGDRVLEAGCGWGALARHMAVSYGARVTACNVSREQIHYARERAEQAGLGDRVTFLEEDFRNVGGRYDVFVSVGMLEHVGRRNYGDLGRVIHERLDPERGRGLLHFIGRNHHLPLNTWIRRRVFPGAYPPTLAEVLEGVLEPWDFSVLDVENLRLHYERTLALWRTRFENTADLAATMFDDAFVRTWRLYLSGSQAAFSTGWLQLFQLTFARPRDNDLPWSRAGLYAEEPLGEL
jgi:cyclopropane-fatty-acyl-phospholipid synthase